MYINLDRLRTFYNLENIGDLFSNEKIVHRLRNVRMFYKGNVVIFYRTNEIIKYYYFENGDWLVKEATNDFLGRVSLLEHDYCDIVGIPYRPNLLEETIDENRKQETGSEEKIMGVIAISTIVTLASFHIYKVVKSIKKT